MSFSDWKEVKLEDITINFNKIRIPLSSKQRERKQGIYPYYGAQGVIDYIDEYIFEGKYLLIAEDGANLETRNEDIARLTNDKEKFWVNNHAHILKENDKSDIRYIKYFLNKEDLSGYITGSAQPKLNKSNLNKISIFLPPLQEQKAIANILSTLDEKIETNNQINKNLETMASEIFKHWFVDFEFPDENGKPYKSSGGVMVESEMGLIPEGWGVKTLKNISKEIITGKTPPTKKTENYGKKYLFTTIPDMHNQTFITKTERMLSEQGHQTQKNKLLPENSIIVSCIATVGLVSINEKPSHTNQQINSITVGCKNDLYYLYESLKLLKSKLESIGATGSTTLNVNKGQFENIKIIYAPNHIREKFNSIIENNFNMIKRKQLENESLTNLRNTLLPKLMSGQLRVPLDK